MLRWSLNKFNDNSFWVKSGAKTSIAEATQSFTQHRVDPNDNLYYALVWTSPNII
jgi:hypothetical protein